MAAVGATEHLRLLQGIPSQPHWSAEPEPWLEFASKLKRRCKNREKQSMMGEEELLGNFFPKTLPVFFVVRLFHETEKDDFPSLISYSDIVSPSLPDAGIIGSYCL